LDPKEGDTNRTISRLGQVETLERKTEAEAEEREGGISPISSSTESN